MSLIHFSQTAHQIPREQGICRAPHRGKHNLPANVPPASQFNSQHANDSPPERARRSGWRRCRGAAAPRTSASASACPNRSAVGPASGFAAPPRRSQSRAAASAKARPEKEENPAFTGNSSNPCRVEVDPFCTSLPPLLYCMGRPQRARMRQFSQIACCAGGDTQKAAQLLTQPGFQQICTFGEP